MLDQLVLGRERVGDVLFAYGADTPDQSGVAAFCLDGGNEIVISMIMPSDMNGELIERVIAGCRGQNSQVTAFAVAAANEDGGWSCFSCDNTLDCTANVFVPVDNEGVLEWGHFGVSREDSTVQLLSRLASVLWKVFEKEGVATVDQGGTS